MDKREQFEFLFLLLLYNIALYFLFQISYLLSVIINSIILIMLGYINVRANEKIIDIIDEVKLKWRKK